MFVVVASLTVGCTATAEPPTTPAGTASSRSDPANGAPAGLAVLDTARAALERGDHEAAAQHAAEAGALPDGAGDVRAASAWQLRGHALLDRKQCKEAALEYQRALALRERVLGPHAHDVAVSLGSVAEAHRCSGDHASAIPHFDRVYRILSSDPAYLEERTDIAKRLAVSLRHVSNDPRAAAVLNDAAAAVKTTRGRDHPLHLSLLGPLDSVLRALGQTDAANALWEGLSVQEYCAPMACSDVPPDPSRAVPGPAPTVRVANAAEVVARLRPLFAACYNASLRSNPGASGRIQLTLRVASDGRVTYVTGRRSGAPADDATRCVLMAGLAARFAPPEGGPVAHIVVPVTFTPKASK